MLTADRAQPELKDGLKSPAKVFIEEPVNYWVNAAVEKGKPVGERVDVDVNKPVLVFGKSNVICQHHQRPQRQPGQDEEQGHNEEHFDNSLFFL